MAPLKAAVVGKAGSALGAVELGLWLSSVRCLEHIVTMRGLAAGIDYIFSGFGLRCAFVGKSKKYFYNHAVSKNRDNSII